MDKKPHNNNNQYEDRITVPLHENHIPKDTLDILRQQIKDSEDKSEKKEK